MKKIVLVKIDCHTENNLDRKLLDVFFEKIKLYLQINNKLPEKISKIKKIKKI